MAMQVAVLTVAIDRDALRTLSGLYPSVFVPFEGVSTRCPRGLARRGNDLNAIRLLCAFAAVDNG